MKKVRRSDIFILALFFKYVELIIVAIFYFIGILPLDAFYITIDTCIVESAIALTNYTARKGVK